MSSAAATANLAAPVCQSDQRFHGLLEHLPTAAYMCDRDGLITYCNKRAVELWQRRPRLHDPEDRYCGSLSLFNADGISVPHDQSCLAHAIQENRDLDGQELVIGCPDGSRVDVRVHAHPYWDDAGKIDGAVILLVDLTAERKTEERLKQAARTEAVGKLISGLSHEFNNLLTVIGGCAEFALLTTDPQDPNHEVLGEIAVSIEKASLLTSQLLAVCKKQIIQPRCIKIDDLVRRTGPLVRRIVGEDIEVQEVLDSTDRFVKVDPGQLEQILLTLAVHAQGAMPDGGILKIETRCVAFARSDCESSAELKPGNFVVVSVSQTGADAMLGSNEPTYFSAADRQPTGADLGITVVREFVRKSGGFTTVTHEIEGGSAFNIYLPVSDQPSEVPLQATHAAEKLSGTETVLVVEDDPAVKAIICRALARHGYRVLEAGDGMEALRHAQQDPNIQLVISDVVMPQMSGHQLAAKLAAQNPTIKVMFMSGYSEDSVFCKIIGEQNVAFLQKPFAPSEVARSVRNLLDGGSGS